MPNRRTGKPVNKTVGKDSTQSAKPSSQPSLQASSSIPDGTRSLEPATTTSLEGFVLHRDYEDKEDTYDAPDGLDAGASGETPSGRPPASAHPSPPHGSSTSSSAAQSNWWYHRISEVGTKEYAGYSPGDQVDTHVVGVTFEGRQTVVAQLSPGERLWLRREPHNPHDGNAIIVERQNGQQIGYISRAMAALLAPHFDNYGKPVSAVVTVLVGENSEYSNLGVRIRFKIPEPPPPVDDYYGQVPF
jgi:hypothetical protein